MILQQNQNTPVTSPQIIDADTMLTAYRAWKGFAWLTSADLFEFVSHPSAERRDFFETQQISIEMVKHFIIQTY